MKNRKFLSDLHLGKARRRYSSTATKENILVSAKKSPQICTTILARNKDEFLRTLAKAAPLSDIAELRIDYLDEPDVGLIKELIEESPLPLIVTNRSERDGGLFEESKESLRISLIKSILGAHPAFIDVELELPDKERSKLLQLADENNVVTICSHHDLVSTPSVPAILKLAKAISQTRADIAKLVFSCRNTRETSRILEAANIMDKTENLFTVFGMGKSGTITRLASLMLGSCLIYCSLGRADKKLGQISAGYARRYIDSLNSYGWPKIEKDRGRLLKLFQEKLRTEKVDHILDPLAALEKRS